MAKKNNKNKKKSETEKTAPEITRTHHTAHENIKPEKTEPERTGETQKIPEITTPYQTIQQAAERLGVSPGAVAKRMDKLGIERVRTGRVVLISPVQFQAIQGQNQTIPHRNAPGNTGNNRTGTHHNAPENTGENQTIPHRNAPETLVNIELRERIKALEDDKKILKEMLEKSELQKDKLIEQNSNFQSLVMVFQQRARDLEIENRKLLLEAPKDHIEHDDKVINIKTKPVRAQTKTAKTKSQRYF